MDAKLFYNAKAELGEGAIWSTINNKLYWVDIEGRCFNVLDPLTLENTVYPTGEKIGTVVPVNAEMVLVALENGLATINLSDGSINYRLKTTIHSTHSKRFNDGKCDHEGRLWVGTLSMEDIPCVSSLYCITNDFVLQEKVTGVSISNGITWNIDKNAMYYIDTPTSKVVKYKFDSSSGQISDAETIIEIPTEMGYPDGMTIDNDGMLWIALWDGFGVARFDPDTGTLLQKINVPAPKVTSCAFGGENLDTLFITTARVEMSKHALEKYPLSGSIFAAKTGVKGLPALPFKL